MGMAEPKAVPLKFALELTMPPCHPVLAKKAYTTVDPSGMESTTMIPLGLDE